MGRRRVKRDIETVTKKYTFFNNLTLRRGYRQKNRYSCGYFCAKALINSLGNGSDKNLVKKLKLTNDGVRQNNLISTLRDRGVSASIYYDLSLRDMKHHLNNGKYILVYRHDVEHWLVLYKVSWGGLHFYDPEGIWSLQTHWFVEDKLKGFGIVCGSK
jgi:ABC-type bacteriocin/lantibiotic exporter with double-glycine peptidase domain